MDLWTVMMMGSILCYSVQKLLQTLQCVQDTFGLEEMLFTKSWLQRERNEQRTACYSIRSCFQPSNSKLYSERRPTNDVP
mmetsp:Transcript_123892/g.231853  ORF Transcript_123892/g.231853 Transcript_123892/m.231853 type:complete len:80 (+) Transcript_123892:75-314(+)